jgi:hypothetical protein
MEGFIVIIGLFAVLFAILGVVLLIRNMANAGNLKKAKALLEAGEKGKAVDLFLKSLRFQLGNPKAPETLEQIIAIYRSSGQGDTELDKFRAVYTQLNDELKRDLKELDGKKWKGNKKIDAIGLLDKEYKVRFDKEFVTILPKLN